MNISSEAVAVVTVLEEIHVYALKNCLNARKVLHNVRGDWHCSGCCTDRCHHFGERKQVMKKFALGLLAAACASALWASDTVRDEFFWLGEMNKATTVINTDEKLLDKAVVKKVAHGLQTVIANGNKQGGPRPK